ncbi:4-alpha-glucanotransferase DPE2 [Histomonas meleagridis]|uniref:4-alpha-glucanotransferase DPE2 n=1 Tax=Histomonas meleagridis TaxID=135588 RepID=UPI003559D33D|nr:4-alpha-glucanotransferase DPE2 [Histomonas meleagridis]KAH0798086.1 4-alpha-glucanotransferase DPE2 [Histomonas meleagridis]
MSVTNVTLRFTFQAYQRTDVSVLWCKIKDQSQKPDYENILKLKNSNNSLNYSADLTISEEPRTTLCYKFRYGDNKYSNPGTYLITNSLQDPLLITEYERIQGSSKGVTLRFKINYQTYYGQILYVVGSLPELGHWDNSKGLRLYHSNSPPQGYDLNGLFSDNKFNWQCDLKLPFLPDSISYRYVVLNESATPFVEPGNVRNFTFPNYPVDFMEFNDVWRWNELTQNLFSKRLFDEMFFVKKYFDKPIKGREPISSSGHQETSRDYILCTFCAHCGVVGRSRNICVVGSIPELGQWNPKSAIPLEPSADLQWSKEIAIPPSQFPFEFKFIASEEPESVVWETHENRTATISDASGSTNKNVVIDSWHINFPNLSFHGAGVIVNVNDLSVFDFGVLNLLIDWARNVGFASVLISGILDVTALTAKFETLPVNGFALNPLHIDLKDYGFNTTNNDPQAILSEKLIFLKQLWESRKNEFLTEVNQFKKSNDWINDYEKLCYSQFNHTDIHHEVPHEYSLYVDFVQYLCYKQLHNSIDHAHSINIAIGTDIPFALSENSAEAYLQPTLFMQDYYLGIAPTSEKPTGSIMRSYPYNFSNAEEWFQKRIRHFSKLFSMIRLDSTILYFRQFVVPRKTSLTAVFGHYEPSVNISYAELETWGLWDIKRYTEPFIRAQFLDNLFGEDALKIHDIFLKEESGLLCFKPEFNSERSLIETKLSPEFDTLRKKYLKQLIRLMDEILLIKVGENEYRPRIKLQYAVCDEPKISSYSFSQLPSYHQTPFLRLEDEYVNNKQKILWVFNGKQILQHITAINDATFISDAAGIDGELCDETLQSVGVLPSRVQMEGRNKNMLFDDIRGYPFLSVATPQRNFKKSIRRFWTSSREKAERLWEEEFWETGKTPVEYTDKVALNIMKQHCWSGSMWAIFPIDSLVGTGDKMVGENNEKIDILKYLKDEIPQKEIRDVLIQTQRK